MKTQEGLENRKDTDPKPFQRSRFILDRSHRQHLFPVTYRVGRSLIPLRNCCFFDEAIRRCCEPCSVWPFRLFLNIDQSCCSPRSTSAVAPFHNSPIMRLSILREIQHCEKALCAFPFPVLPPFKAAPRQGTLAS